MERRKFMKAAGGIAGVGAVGGAGLLATRGASATGGFEDLGTVQVESDDGTVQYIAIYGDSVVNWEGFENSATEFELFIDLTVNHPNEDEPRASKQIHSTGKRALSEDGDWGGSGESHSGPGTSGNIKSDVGLDENGAHDASTDWHIISSDEENPYGLPTDPVNASKLEVDGDGDDVTFDVTMESEYRWYNAAGDLEHDETFTSVLEVNVQNIPSDASTSDGGDDDGVVVSNGTSTTTYEG